MILNDFKSCSKKSQRFERLQRAFIRTFFVPEWQSFGGFKNLEEAEFSWKTETSGMPGSYIAWQKHRRCGINFGQKQSGDISIHWSGTTNWIAGSVKKSARVRLSPKFFIPMGVSRFDKWAKVHPCWMVLKNAGGQLRQTQLNRPVSDIFTGDETWIYQFDS